MEKIKQYVACGDVPEHPLNTSAIEGRNLTIRLFDAGIRRRTVTFRRSKEAYRLVWIFSRDTIICVAIFVRELEETGERWEACQYYPDNKAWDTDHVWSIWELMFFLHKENIN